MRSGWRAAISVTKSHSTSPCAASPSKISRVISSSRGSSRFTARGVNQWLTSRR